MLGVFIDLSAAHTYQNFGPARYYWIAAASVTSAGEIE
jgi:hypothetical protein